MQLYRKPALAVLFTFFCSSLFAQYPGMGAFRAQQNMQFAQQQMFMQMNMMNYGDRNYNPKYTFIVTMKDSTKMTFDSQILNDTILKKNYLLLVDKRFKRSDTNRFKKIYPSQTISIARDIATSAVSVHTNTEEPQPVYLVGNATDSCWTFKVITGAITAYSSLSELPDDYLFKPFAITAIQLNNGPIVKYTEDNLKQMIGQDDLDALEYIQKKNYFKAIKRYNKDAEKAAKKKH
jgi:hypothetical protein